MRLTTSPPSCAKCNEIWEPKPSGTLWDTLGLLRASFYLFCKGVDLYLQPFLNFGRARSEPGGTRRCTGGEVNGKLANGVGSQYSHAISERGVSSITQADAHTSAALTPPPI